MIIDFLTLTVLATIINYEGKPVPKRVNVYDGAPGNQRGGY